MRVREDPSETDNKLIWAADIRVLKRLHRRNGRRTRAKYALYVPLEAKPGKEKDVSEFLRSALPLVNAEPGTISWFAIQEGPSRFAIRNIDDEAGRDADLNGKVAAALMEKVKAGELFAKCQIFTE